MEKTSYYAQRICWLWMLCTSFATVQASTLLSCPSGKLQAEITAESSSMNILLKDELGSLLTVKTLQFGWEKDIIQGKWRIIREERKSVNETWQTIYGERRHVRDCYNELTLHLQSEGNRKEMALCLRMYEEGLAFKHVFNRTDFWRCKLQREDTQFLFADDYPTWTTLRAQALYKQTTLDGVSQPGDRPQVIQIDRQRYVAIGEAALVDYARMYLGKATSGHGIQSVLAGEVDLELAGYQSPWRYVMYATHPGKLVEHNYFLLNLNQPCRIADTSWIKPGKVLREVTLTTEGGLACVDFAAEHHIEYVEFDAGWYGPENNKASDATTITVDTARSKGVLDLHRVIRHAGNRGVGILLYVNRYALKQQLDELFPLYQKWGIKGVKFGFVDVGSQEHTSWLHHAVRLAAKYKLMVDIHDEYRPTGYSRTYPNLLTQEGIRGDEESPDLKQTLHTFYNRMICGAGDYTNCYYDRRVSQKMGGRAAQLAKRVALYSPWQFIYWYDRPTNSPRRVGGADNSENIILTDEITPFYTTIPTVWDETRFIQGETGEYAIVARRSATDWYVAIINAGPQRTISLPLDFLDCQDDYRATIYEQPAEGKKESVSIKRISLHGLSVIERKIVADSGCVIHFSRKGL